MTTTNTTTKDPFIKVPNILNIGQHHNDFDWEDLMPGVQISRLNHDDNACSSALLHLDTGVKIPGHLHTGYEYVFLLSGQQVAKCVDSGDNTSAKTGDLVIARPGSKHEVQNIEGGYVLIIWEKPVVFQS